MNNKTKISRQALLLIVIFLISVAIFVILYQRNRVEKEQVNIAEGSTPELSEWEIENSSLNGLPLMEDKNIYSDGIDANLYDVYISVFPTKDESGEMIDFSAFALHQSRDHTYNPILNCNILILGQDEAIDPLLSLDSKNATIRVRGNSSRGDIYKSYKIKLTEEAAPFYGQTTLNLNKHSEDITKIATKLETDLLIGVDNIASYRTYFMRVWIRDTSDPGDENEFKYYGLYTQMEQPNKAYLEIRGLSSSASLYKARDFNFNSNSFLKDINDPEYDEEEFESILSIREANDHSKLLEMLDALNDGTSNFDTVFHQYFNEDNYLTWLSFNLLMGNNDIINHNFILYNPDNSMTWYFIPWDFDGTLRFGDHESTLMKLPISLKGIQKLNQSVLHRRYLRLDGSLLKIQTKMEELLQETVTRENIDELITLYRPMLAETIPLYPDIELLDAMTPVEHELYLDHLYDGILTNYDNFIESSKYPSPMYVATPVKNADGTMHFAWEVSYSYQGLPVTYSVRVYSDYYMENLLLEQTNIVDTEYDSEAHLGPGVYYVQVTATDREGHEQLSMERFETMLTDVKGYNVNGLLEFTVE